MDLKDEFAEIAERMNSLNAESDAAIHYDPMADGLVWADEIPKPRLFSDLAFRYLLRFRSSLISEAPLEPIRPYWELAQTLFPNWPGFDSARCKPSLALRSALAHNRQLTAEVFGLEDRYE